MEEQESAGCSACTVCIADCRRSALPSYPHAQKQRRWRKSTILQRIERKYSRAVGKTISSLSSAQLVDAGSTSQHAISYSIPSPIVVPSCSSPPLSPGIVRKSPNAIFFLGAMLGWLVLLVARVRCRKSLACLPVSLACLVVVSF